MNTTPKLMTRQETERQWELYKAAVGEIPPERLRGLAFSKVSDLEIVIGQMDVFDFERYTAHAIAYEVRHAALRRVTDLEGQGIPV